MPPRHRQLIIYELEGDPSQIIQATVAAREARLITRNASLASDSFGWLYTRVYDLERSALERSDQGVPIRAPEESESLR